jgi:peptidyl-tRNA hydrolase
MNLSGTSVRPWLDYYKVEPRNWYANSWPSQGPSWLSPLRSHTHLLLLSALNVYRSLIIHDAADLPTGALRLKLGGTAGGQNGVKSIIEKLGTKEFPRLKLGVGKPERETTDLATWVLSRFHSADKTKIEELQAKAAGCFATWLEHGAEKAMNDFHSEPSTKVKKVKAPKAAANPTSPEASSSAAAIQEG